MKRDMELVREILIQLADSDRPLYASEIACGKWNEGTVSYHFSIMREAGLIRATLLYADAVIAVASAERLTWEGNEFLDSVRDEGIWNKVKRQVAETAGTASYDVFKALAVKISADAVLSGV